MNAEQSILSLLTKIAPDKVKEVAKTMDTVDTQIKAVSDKVESVTEAQAQRLSRRQVQRQSQKLFRKQNLNLITIVSHYLFD